MIMAKRQLKRLRYQFWAGVLLVPLVAPPAARLSVDVPSADLPPLTSLRHHPAEQTAPSLSLTTVALGLFGASILGALLGWQAAQRRRVWGASESSNSLQLKSATCKTASVAWAVAPAIKRELAQQGQTLAVRLYRLTGHTLTASDLIAQLHCVEPELEVPIPGSDRDYKIELGATSPDGTWQSLAWSALIHIPACQPHHARQTVAPMRGSVDKHSPIHFDPQNYIVLTSKSVDDLYAVWQISSERTAQALNQGGRKQMLRIHDVTGLNPSDRTAHKTHQYECCPDRKDLHILISRSNRDYIAELGYITADGKWLSLACSAVTHVADQASSRPVNILPTGSPVYLVPHFTRSRGAEPLLRPQNHIKHDKP